MGNTVSRWRDYAESTYDSVSKGIVGSARETAGLDACIVFLHVEAAFEDFAMEVIADLHEEITEYVGQQPGLSCSSCKVLIVNGTPRAQCEECNKWVKQIRKYSSDGKLNWDLVSLQSVKRKPRQLGKLFHPDYFTSYRVHRTMDELLTLISKCTFFQQFTNKELMQQVTSIRNKVFRSTSMRTTALSAEDVEKIICLLEWQISSATMTTPSTVKCRQADDQIKRIVDKTSSSGSEARLIFHQHVKDISQRLDAYEIQADRLTPEQQYDNTKVEIQRIEAEIQTLKSFIDFHRIAEHDIRNYLEKISSKSKRVYNKIVKLHSKRQEELLIPCVKSALEKVGDIYFGRKRFSNHGYLDWLKATLVLQYAKEGVADYTLDVVGKLYTSIKNDAKTKRGDETECYACCVQLLMHTPKLKSDCKDCVTWFNRIIKNKDRTAKLNWKIPLRDVKRNPWTLASLFQPFHCMTHKGPHDADIPVLLKLMLNCTYFKDCIGIGYVRQVLEKRNEVIHSSTMEIKHDTLTFLIEAVLNLLMSSDGLKGSHQCKKAMDKIRMIRNGKDIPNLKDEREVLSHHVVEMKQQLEATEHQRHATKTDDQVKEVRFEVTQQSIAKGQTVQTLSRGLEQEPCDEVYTVCIRQVYALQVQDTSLKLFVFVHNNKISETIRTDLGQINIKSIDLRIEIEEQLSDGNSEEVKNYLLEKKDYTDSILRSPDTPVLIGFKKINQLKTEIKRQKQNLKDERSILEAEIERLKQNLEDARRREEQSDAHHGCQDKCAICLWKYQEVLKENRRLRNESETSQHHRRDEPPNPGCKQQ